MEHLPLWSVADVEPEAQEAAKLAARKASLSLGTWLSQTILSVAAHELKRNSGHPESTPGPLPPALTTDVLLDSIQRLTKRIETAEERTAESIVPLAQKVTELSNQIEDVSTRASVSTGPMERAMSRMAERVERLEQTAVAKPNGGWRGLFSRHS